MANLFLWGRLDLSEHFAGHYSDDDFSPVIVRVRNQMRLSSHEEGGLGGGVRGIREWMAKYLGMCVCVCPGFSNSSISGLNL